MVVLEPSDEKVLKCEQNLSFVTATAAAVAYGAASAMRNKAPTASELNPPLERKETERAALTERCACESEMPASMNA